MFNILNMTQILKDPNFYLSLMALIIALLAFLRPWISIQGQLNLIHFLRRFSVTIENRNPFHRTIVDISCEITLSHYQDFHIVKTQKLDKEWIVCLRSPDDNYKFKSTLTNIRKFLRIRILAPNIIGIKKVFEIKAKYNPSVLQYEIFETKGFRWLF